MAELAEESGKADRLKAIEDAIAELDGLVHGAAIDLAPRADEFSGAALGAQRVPIDSHIDTEMLQGWLDEQLTNANDALTESHNIADPDAMALAAQRAGWEMLYYEQMIQSLDKDISPLATSSEMIAYLRAKGSMAQFEFMMQLEAGLVTTLSDPTFIRSIAEMGVDTFAPFVGARIDAGLDFLGPDSLRLPGAGEVPPFLPATGLFDTVSYVDEVRDRSFSRSALEASAEALERRVLDFSEHDALGPSRAPSSGVDSRFDGTPATSPGNHRAPADNAQAPIIDEQSGLWVVESSAEPDTTPTTSDSASPHAHRDGTSSQASPVSWDSGLRESGDSEVGAVAGDADEAQTSDLFKAASEPEDENADGASDSPGSGGTRGEDANPTGTVSEPTDSITTTSGMGSGTEPGSSGTGNPLQATPARHRASRNAAPGASAFTTIDGLRLHSDKTRVVDFLQSVEVAARRHATRSNVGAHPLLGAFQKG